MNKEELIKLLKGIKMVEVKNVIITYVYEKNYDPIKDKTRTITIGDDKNVNITNKKEMV